jgi:hypothetical protein
LVRTTLAKIAKADSVNIESFFDFTTFPQFDKAGFLDPATPLIPELVHVSGQIQQSGTTQLTDRNPHTLLLARLLINSLKDSVSLIAALRYFTGTLVGLNQVLDRASSVHDTHKEASMIACWMLNSANVILFLRFVSRKPEWIEDNYRRSAQIACKESIDHFATITSPIVNRCVFQLDEKPDLLSDWDKSMHAMFVTIPARPYLDMVVENQDDLVKALAWQLALGVKSEHKGMFTKFPALGFVKAVADQQISIDSPAWRDFAASAKKSTTINMWIIDGLRCKQLPTWLMFLIASTPVVKSYYHPWAPLAGSYQAKFIVSSVVRFLKIHPD